MACWRPCVKFGRFLLLLVNFFFFMVTLTLIIAGAIIYWGDLNTKEAIIPGSLLFGQNASYPVLEFKEMGRIINSFICYIGNSGLIMFVVGIILLFISFYGLVATCTENQSLLWSYNVAAIAVTLLITTLGILFVSFDIFLNTGGAQDLSFVLREAYTFRAPDRNRLSTLPDFTAVIDLLQIRARCCGSYNGSDYNLVRFGRPSDSSQIPWSCCILQPMTLEPQDPSCTKSPTITNSYFNMGCWSVVGPMVLKYGNYIGFTMIAMAIVMLPNCGFLIYLSHTLVLEKYRM